MEIVSAARWMVREGVRTPLSWILGASLALLGLSLGAASPLGILAGGNLNNSYLGSIWFLSSYCGAIVGLLLLDRAGSVWDELSLARQVWVGGLLLVAVSTIYGCAGILPLRLFGPELLPWSGALLCAAHWSAQASFVQRIGSSLPGKCIALACLGWWIPAVLGSSPAWARVDWVLSPERHLEAHAGSIETSVGALVDTIPIVAWWVAAALLPTRTALKR